MDLMTYLMGVMGPIGVTVFTILGILVVLGQVVVELTPTQKDDAFMSRVKEIPFLGQLVDAIAAFAPIQKKPKK